MGPDRERDGRRRETVRAVVYATCGAVLLAGCASMPDSGDLRGVESTPRQDAQVRVFALPPHENAPPGQIVQGFLEALTSDDPHYETARKYLTAQAAKSWRPDASTTVLDGGPTADAVHAGGRDDTDDYASTLTGGRFATLDSQQSYEPADGQYRATLHLTREKKSGQWRIDDLPQGVVMGKSDFLRNYTSVNKYYFASNTPSQADAQLVSVADPVYVRKKVDPMTQTVSSLIEGPSRWLGPVVRSSFPTGTALKKGVTSLAPDDQNRLTVPLNDKANRVGSAKCTEMAAQLLYTLQDLTPTGVDEVALQRANGSQLCVLDKNGAETVAARGVVQRPEFQYFIDAKHRLVRVSGNDSPAADVTPVPGALGEGVKQLRSAAVSRDEETAAGVSLDGSMLYVGSLVSGGSLGEPVLTSQGATKADRLTTPSWDGDGDLWVADRDPRKPRLLLLAKGAGEPLEVRTPGLDGRIEAVRVAADGVRIALIVEKGGQRSLYIGRIERDERAATASDGAPKGKLPAEPGRAAGQKADERSVVSVLELDSVTPQLEEVTAMSWAGDSRLVVVGREQGGVQQMGYVQVDGSTPVGSAPAALTGVKGIAASEDERMPLVAYSEEDGIVRLLSGAKWQKLVEGGSAPVYPG
ncbi:LpqB family beta-propeller domain-containing protein [Streptomyces sp. ME02-8801-2C]|uniref:LpqB family beta-propeller domain-containing protein n=1 Tax=Streptomyces sp. ME02-8801-2C TaxID=3028680 RepID=UPI0029AD1561|nr:LpqB family beta-propeller domain-containing protein [Streptomyces sp. ME02-8801-2C]MDX3458241.1 LpqB family beta-propeller domain-containing protein [Streptomyces sp. ME02-8801-2C]